MAKYNQKPKFKVTINYPTEENKEEYERRKARAVAKVLIDTLPPQVIDKLVEKLERENANDKN
ncbi:hypothetical protein Z962_p0014 (plasmid) [Clostridium botulinum C/D str. BKT12695]|nr:hypothetical protein Z962_p0014 [Clostridium botulinum C/D str. BKT12695]